MATPHIPLRRVQSLRVELIALQAASAGDAVGVGAEQVALPQLLGGLDGRPAYPDGLVVEPRRPLCLSDTRRQGPKGCAVSAFRVAVSLLRDEGAAMRECHDQT